jgi:histone H3/H4
MIRLIKEILQRDLSHLNIRMSQEAVACLHVAAEPLLVAWFEMLYSIIYILANYRNLSAHHAKRETVMIKDAEFVHTFVKMIDPCSPLAVGAVAKESIGANPARSRTRANGASGIVLKIPRTASKHPKRPPTKPPGPPNRRRTGGKTLPGARRR